MKLKKILLAFIIIFLTTFSKNIAAEEIRYIDFSKVLNESKAGATAQISLKKKFKSEAEKFKKQDENLRKAEQDIIAKKKLVTTEEYKKKVKELREQVAKLQKDKKKSFNDVSKLRNNSRNALLKELNPILLDYMKENKVDLVLDKKTIILGNKNLEITSDIIKILNTKVQTLKTK
jgi:Skp family chaperone for outer membrane proteins